MPMKNHAAVPWLFFIRPIFENDQLSQWFIDSVNNKHILCWFLTSDATLVPWRHWYQALSSEQQSCGFEPQLGCPKSSQRLKLAQGTIQNQLWLIRIIDFWTKVSNSFYIYRIRISLPILDSPSLPLRVDVNNGWSLSQRPFVFINTNSKLLYSHCVLRYYYIHTY